MEGVARQDAELLAKPGGGVDGVAVVDEVLSEDGPRLVEALEQRRVEMVERDGLVHHLRDELDEAGLGDRILAHHVVGLSIGFAVPQHRRHRVGEVLHMPELAEPAAVARHQHGSAAPDPVHEERLVVPRVERAHDVGRPDDADRAAA